MILLAPKYERRSSEGSIPFVGSIKAEMEELNARARFWQSDAELVELEIFLSENSSNRLISAQYQSRTHKQEIYIVYVNSEDSNFNYLLLSSDFQKKHIQIDRWLIDSQEAISIFSENDGIRICIIGQSGDSNRLVLRNLEDKPIWDLLLDNCAAANRTRMDATTGEIINSE